MQISKNRWNYSFREGTDTENRFKILLQSEGYQVRKSNKIDDIHKHIDFDVNGHGVDVKGKRYTNTIWLEIQNVRGKDGWLKGEATYIAFDIIDLKQFVFFKRKDLLEFVSQFKEETEDKREHLKWYSRKKWNRKDKIIKVKYEHIKHLKVKYYAYT